ncbi:hypothetical protein [Micromonospora sagamiensis]|uniref:Uncharacterized protein n=1 Tax=Micromonospora sagamiensis TaxID=47875 RepID=A0A562WJW4_9ACTN|nr:hypothetical protein [Micromonospora sagamiensis]TWJ29824.1 hypothetical protein JD81_03355 [Micromonospora sagamiensis]BCL17147.1 hypothetical protein GCM10017556_48860 [Micromonospora sagamiensis]
MSIIEDIGAQVRAASDELPLAPLAQALEKFALAAERLRWVRQESSNPMGVPELSAAVEHAESAGHALRVAQEQLASYLAAIGLGADGAPAAKPQPRQPAHDAPRDAAPPDGDPAGEPTPAPAVRRWWAVRVAELTGGSEGEPAGPDEQVADSRELLRRVVGGVKAGDRTRLHTELRRAHADVGLGLATVTPPLLRELASDLLGHPPKATDLPKLRNELDGRVRDLLPGLPPPVLETVLTRVCRMPPPRQRSDDEQPHPADPAVTAGVVTGLLLARLGRDLPPERPDDERPPAGSDRDAGAPPPRAATDPTRGRTGPHG